jgi:hypothetical protein
VLRLRPYWQIRGTNDSRQRPTHKRAQNTILSADNPFWRRAYPPFGYCCRCRTIARSKRWVDSHGGPTRVPEGLPDPGFDSGIDASLIPDLQVDMDGTRSPTAPKAAHPIDRDHSGKAKPVPIQPKPVDMEPVPIVYEPSPAMPSRDIPIPGRSGNIEAGVHVHDLKIGRGVSKRATEAVMSSLSPDELGAMRVDPVKLLKVARTIGGSSRSTTFGLYRYGSVTDEIAVAASRAPSTYGKKLVPGSTHNISQTRATAEEAIQSTMHHELGHRLHVRAPTHIRQTIESTFRSLANPITKYAKQNAFEYFAECYSAYRSEKAVLLAHDPEGYKLVEYVLNHWGILDV